MALLRPRLRRALFGGKPEGRSRRTYLALTAIAIVVGVAVGTSFLPGAGTFIGNTSYVAGGSGGGAACPVPTGWSAFPETAPSLGFTAGGMAYDYTDGYLVYFGGYTGAATPKYVSPTWEYSGGCWKNLTTLSPSPDGRSEFAMAWDGADDQVLLFGGADAGTQCNATASDYFYMCGDTWGFVGGVWHVICHNGDATGTGGPDTASSYCLRTPPPMNAPEMTYDPNSADCNQGGVSGATAGCVFLVGGLTCSAKCNTPYEWDNESRVVWEFFGNAWHESSLGNTTSAPAARQFAGFTYDSVTTDDYLLLYGGENTTCNPVGGWHCSYLHQGCVQDATNNYCDDAWSLSGGTWQQQCQGINNFWNHSTDKSCFPPGEAGLGMTFDTNENYVVAYGGFNGFSSKNDSDANGYVYGAWKWVGGAGGTGDWVAIGHPIVAGLYITRYAPAMTYDPGLQDSYVVVLGGTNAGGYYASQFVYK